MSSLSAEDVKKIANLARLAIDENDVEAYSRQLTNILEFVEQMNAVDTSGVSPMAHPQDQTQRLREDKVIEQDQRENFQALAPKTEAGLYLVPKVIE